MGNWGRQSGRPVPMLYTVGEELLYLVGQKHGFFKALVVGVAGV